MDIPVLWIKAGHVAANMFWAAGLLYLPRLFVYHAEAGDEEGRRRFCVMERRLYWSIMLPSMIVALILGLMLLPHYLGGGWVLAKLALGLLLAVFHVWCGFVMRAFARGANPHSPRFFRIANEVPALIILALVILAVVKPF